jgi:adenylate cyclase
MQNCIYIRDRYSTLEYSEMFQYLMESASLQPIEQIYIQYYIETKSIPLAHKFTTFNVPSLVRLKIKSDGVKVVPYT